jgi:hypothetical protein
MLRPARRHDVVALPGIEVAAGPWYRRLGFRPLADAALGPELAAIRRRETARGLDVVPRLAMRRVVGQEPPSSR